MGYYTDYSIKQASKEAEFYLQSLSGYDSWGDSELWEVKWYSWKNDLKETSEKYPNEVIILDGVGEEYPDIWRCYAKNGKLQVVEANITFPEMDDF